MTATIPVAKGLQQLKQRGIVWLKPVEDVDHSVVLLSGLDLDCMNHPVLVVQVDSLKRVAEVCIIKITSFRGQPISSRPVRYQNNYLPIHPSPPHPITDVLLFLEPGHRLQSNSNVKISESFMVPFTLLLPARKATMMKKASFECVKKLLPRESKPSHAHVAVEHPEYWLEFLARIMRGFLLALWGLFALWVVYAVLWGTFQG